MPRGILRFAIEPVRIITVRNEKSGKASLSFPEDVIYFTRRRNKMTETTSPDQRRHKRYPIYCPLEYKAEDDQPKEASITLNISEGGALISANRGLEIDSSVIVKVQLRDETFFMIGRVRHVNNDQENNVHKVGVEFWDKPRAFAKRFYEEVEGIMDYQKKQAQEQKREISLAEASMNWFGELPDMTQ